MWKTRAFHTYCEIYTLIEWHSVQMFKSCEKQERFIGLISIPTMYAICCKLANVANYAFFGVIFCLKTEVTYSIWQISRLCYCAYCFKFNCYSLARIACLRNFNLYILQNARVAVLPLESTCTATCNMQHAMLLHLSINAAHHRHVEGISKETLQQRMGVSNFANNSLSAFTGFLNQSLLYNNILH